MCLYNNKSNNNNNNDNDNNMLNKVLGLYINTLRTGDADLRF